MPGCLIEFGGKDKAEADANARKCMDDFRQRGNRSSDEAVRRSSRRKSWSGICARKGLGATAKVPDMPENHEGWEDASVPPDKLGAYLRDFKKLMDKYNYVGPLYGHFGQGCVHTRLTFDLQTADGIHKWRQFLEEASDLVVRYGGSLSGEHGDGQARGELLARMYSPRDHQCLPRVQGDLGPGLEDESRQGHRSVPGRRKPSRGHELQPAAR